MVRGHQERSQIYTPIGGRLEILGGGVIVTGHHTQLTIAITDSATTVEMR